MVKRLRKTLEQVSLDIEKGSLLQYCHNAQAVNTGKTFKCLAAANEGTVYIGQVVIREKTYGRFVVYRMVFQNPDNQIVAMLWRKMSIWPRKYGRTDR
ncbi:MAG: hypothetical protein ACLRZ6_02760 [Lachnospiraceae bacterium]